MKKGIKTQNTVDKQVDLRTLASYTHMKIALIIAKISFFVITKQTKTVTVVG